MLYWRRLLADSVQSQAIFKQKTSLSRSRFKISKVFFAFFLCSVCFGGHLGVAVGGAGRAVELHDPDLALGGDEARGECPAAALVPGHRPAAGPCLLPTQPKHGYMGTFYR